MHDSASRLRPVEVLSFANTQKIACCVGNKKVAVATFLLLFHRLRLFIAGLGCVVWIIFFNFQHRILPIAFRPLTIDTHSEKKPGGKRKKNRSVRAAASATPGFGKV